MTSAARFSIIINGYSPEEVEEYIANQAARYTGVSQENRQLKDALEHYEQKLREIASSYAQLKEQSNADRLRLADIMVQANKTAADLIEKAETDVKVIIDDANKEAERIKAAAAEDAVELRNRLDSKFCGIHDIFDQITAATETSRQNLLNLFLQADQDARQASSLLHVWKQKNKAEVMLSTQQTKPPPSVPPEANASYPAPENREWLNAMSDLLKNVPPPTKVGC